VRCCGVVGSNKRCMAWFSMQKSQSSIFSSKVNPYWKPEQPPPETNARNLRAGFASSRIRSPTLPAAASVKTSTLGGGGARSAWFIVSDVALMVAFYPAGRRPIKVPDFSLGPASPVRVPRRLHVGPICPMDQLPIDLGANGSFNDGVVNIAQNARLGAEFNPMGRVDVAFDSGLGADQGVDARVLTLFLFEHLPHPWPKHCRLPRFPPTFPAPSKRRPDENCGSSLCLCCCESRPRRASARTPAAIVWVRHNPESSGRSMPGRRAG